MWVANGWTDVGAAGYWDCDTWFTVVTLRTTDVTVGTGAVSTSATLC